MPDIKTREAVKGTIKALDRSAVTAQRMRQVYIQTKEKAEHSVYSSEPSPEEYAADKITDTIQNAAHEVAYHGANGVHSGISAIKKTADTIRKHHDPAPDIHTESPIIDPQIPVSPVSNYAPIENPKNDAVQPAVFPKVTVKTSQQRLLSQNTKKAIPSPNYVRYKTEKGKPHWGYVPEEIGTETIKQSSPVHRAQPNTMPSQNRHISSRSVEYRPGSIPAIQPSNAVPQALSDSPKPGSTVDTPILRTRSSFHNTVTSSVQTNQISPKVRYTPTAKTIRTVGSPGDTISKTAAKMGLPLPEHKKLSVKLNSHTIRTPHALLSPQPTSAAIPVKRMQSQLQSRRIAIRTIHRTPKIVRRISEELFQASKSAVKAIIAGTQALVSMLAAGGTLSLVVIVLILMIGLIAGSSFGIFFSGEVTETGISIRNVVQEINNEYQSKLDEIKAIPHDELETTGSRATWPDILAVYAVKINLDSDNPMEVASVDDEKKAILKEVFWDMNQISYRIETHTETRTEESENGDGEIIETEITITKKILHITISHKSPEEMAEEYHFNAEQYEVLLELLSEDYAQLWSGVLYGIHTGSGDIVAVAASQVGNVGGEPYWRWYGFSSRVAWCACFVSWCANECGYIDAGTIPKFAGCVAGTEWFKAHGQWADGSFEPLPGAIIFFEYDGDGRSDHVGIVEKVENGMVYTIEGNSGDACRQRSYSIGNSEIYGYGLPLYGG